MRLRRIVGPFAIQVAGERSPDQSRTGIDNWLAMTKELDLF